MATYDEVLTLLRDANNRKQWDQAITSVQKKSENELEVKYDAYTEIIQLQTFGDKSQPQGPHFI